MATHFKDIGAALSARLSTLPDLPDVSWQNRAFTPTTGVLFLRETLLPGEVVQSELGESGRDVTTGVYQVDVFAPIGNGKGAAIDQVDAIADHFARNTVLTYNSINVRLLGTSLGASAFDGAWWIVPVNIRYQSYLAPR